MPGENRLVVAASLALAALSWGCELTQSVRQTEQLRESRAWTESQRVVVETFDGAVEIQGWDEPRVEVVATKYALTPQALRAIRVRVEELPEALRVVARRPSGYRWAMGVEMSVKLPRKASVVVRTSNGRVRASAVEAPLHIVTSNGKVEVEESSGPVVARSSNGSVELSRVQGPVEVTTSNGSIEARAISGYAQLRTSNAAIKVEELRGSIRASTSNGRVEVVLLEAGFEPVRIASSNGSLMLVLHKVPPAGLEAITSNGGITLRLPSGQGARLNARTTHGGIRVELPMQEQRGTKTTLEATLPPGGPLLHLQTSNGSIRVEGLGSP